MHRNRRMAAAWLLAAACVVETGRSLWAHPGHGDALPTPPAWRMASDGRIISGWFVKAEGNRVWLVDEANQTTVISIADLDEIGKETVRRTSARLRITDTPPAQAQTDAATKQPVENAASAISSALPAIEATVGGESPKSNSGEINEVSIAVDGDFRIIRSNGIPDHQTGQFPGRGNPNTIAPQNYRFRVPANPKPAEKTTALRMQPFGIAVNGVVFDPGADEWWNGDRTSGWQYEPLTMAPLYMGTDASHAHVQPNGAYHYHGNPTLLVEKLTGGKEKMVIVGWAADGFPIYNNLGHADLKDAARPLKKLNSSYRIKPGKRSGGPGGTYDGSFVADYEYVSGTGDLDECNGITSVTPEYPAGIYHYVLTEQFPYIPRFYRGTPDPSFMRRPGGGPGDRPGRGQPDGRFHLIPPFAVDRLNLTDEQRRQIAPLENETREKLERILTPEQLKILRDARPPRGGPDGPPGKPPEEPAPPQ